MKTRPTPQEGFTLFEMLIVLAIIAIAAVYVLPAVSGRSSTFEITADAIESGLVNARLKALSRGQEARLVFENKKRTFASDDGKLVAEVPPDMAIRLVTARSEASTQPTSIRFFPDGSSSGGEIVLELGGLRRRLLVSWLTGKISIENSGIP
jgi:general secretion pathway protein H